MKRKDKKMPPLILYEKYKYEHHLNADSNKAENTERTKTSAARRIGNLFICLILMSMIFLSTVGLVTLLHPQMRTFLFYVLEL